MIQKKTALELTQSPERKADNSPGKLDDSERKLGTQQFCRHEPKSSQPDSLGLLKSLSPCVSFTKNR